MMHPNGKITNIPISKEDIQRAKALIKISDIDNSYFGDRAELKFEKEVMVILERESSNLPHSCGQITPKKGIEYLRVFITRGSALSTLADFKQSKIQSSKGDIVEELFFKLLKEGLYPISEELGEN